MTKKIEKNSKMCNIKVSLLEIEAKEARNVTLTMEAVKQRLEGCTNEVRFSPILVKGIGKGKIHLFYLRKMNWEVSLNLFDMQSTPLDFSQHLVPVDVSTLPPAVSKKIQELYIPQPIEHGIDKFTKEMTTLLDSQKQAQSKYPIAVVLVKDKNEIKPIIELQKTQGYGHIPILIKKDNIIAIYGNTDIQKWEYQALDASKLVDLNFTPEVQILQVKEIPEVVYAEINAKRAHFPIHQELTNHIILDYKIIATLLKDLKQEWAQNIIEKNLGSENILVKSSDVSLKPALLDETSLMAPAASRKKLLNLYAFILLVYANVFKDYELQYTATRETPVKGLPHRGLTQDFVDKHMQFSKNKKNAKQVAVKIGDSRTVNVSTSIVGDRAQEELMKKEVKSKSTASKVLSRSHYERTFDLAKRYAADAGCVVTSLVFVTENRYTYVEITKSDKNEPTQTKQGEGHILYSIWGDRRNYFIHHLQGAIDDKGTEQAKLKGFTPIKAEGVVLGYAKLESPIDDSMLVLAKTYL